MATSDHLKGPAAVAYDFRSDTVTVPSPDMLAAMVRAPVGDDVFGEDPTIVALEHRVASLLGHEAALFCASGTMSNQLGIRTHLRSGAPHSVLADGRAHVHMWEAGGIAAHCGAKVIAVDVEGQHARGERAEPHLTARDVELHAVPDDGDAHGAPTRLICVENTLHGSVMPLADLKAINEVAHAREIPVHMDGARLWHAAIQTGTELAEWGRLCDSISVCFSKGLGAPVGSALVGPATFIKRARHLRKMYGGGWRQAGVLAAAAMYALDNVFPAQLARTHTLAGTLVEHLRRLGVKIENDPVDTNIVYADVGSVGLTANDWAKAAAEDVRDDAAPIHIFGGATGQIRVVMHYQLAEDAVDRLVAALERAIAAKADA
ncbi:Threonine aldolase [Allomyces javanicus]|nr:Threonine aldolase [Allomyces javanicus]